MEKPMELEDLRRFYAEEIRAVSNIQTEALAEAFARVRREDYLGAGPWQIATPDSWQGMAQAGSPGDGYRTTPDADPAHLYHNVLVAIDAARRLNNGQPSSLAAWLDALELRGGERVAHVGCGVGYYTAIIAETVGPVGRVVGVELDEGLAARASANLSRLPNVEVVCADGGDYDPGPSDAIFVNAGATHPRAVWLDGLNDGGRLIVPLTVARNQVEGGGGFMLKVRREGDAYAARILSPVAIFPCVGSRDEAANTRLREALMRGNFPAVRSLRRDAHEAGEACWLHGEDFCLSTEPPARD
ncbi:MAG TPA: methyltransferase domain-containing protein [Pyrinomonadaceae bacterium]|nr:methyltransferase domain-containing protein [Pyrinomonadaceae bacterium]